MTVTNNFDSLVSLDSDTVITETSSLSTTDVAINELLNEQKLFLQFILDNINYGIIVLDQNLHVRLVNEAAKSISQLDDDFIAGYPHAAEGFTYTRDKGGYKNISDADWNVYLQQRVDELKQPTVQTKDIELIDNRIYRYSCTPLKDGGRLLTYADITENKLVEKELQKERNLLRTMMDAIPEKVYYKDRNSKFIFANKYISEYYGFSNPDELIGKSDFDIHPQKNAEVFFNSEQDLMASATTLLNHEESGVLQGEEVWFLAHKAPVYDSSGEVIGLAGISQDITSRKKSELALSRQNTYLNALHKTSLAIMARLELSELTKTIVEQTSSLINSDSFLYLPSEDGKYLYCGASWGDRQSLDDILITSGEGVVGKVWESKKALLVENYAQWQGQLQVHRQVYSGSVIAVPLGRGEDVIAVLGIGSHLEHFSQTEVEELENFAQTASIALENAQLNERTLKDLRRSKALYEVSQVLASEANTKLKLKTICEIIHAALDACWAVIDDYDTEKRNFQHLVLVDTPEFPLQALDHDNLVEESLMMWALRSKKGLLSSKYGVDQRESLEQQLIRKKQGIGSIAIVPLVIENQMPDKQRPDKQILDKQVNSTFAVMRRLDQPDFNQDDLNFVTTVVNQVAVARKQKQLVDTIDYQASYDSLTGLPNWNFFEDRLWHSIKTLEQEPDAKYRKFAVLCLDVDNFKLINDALGHDIGDVFLQELSRRLQNTINTEITLARMGGDEFALLIPDIKDIQTVHELARSYLSVFEHGYVLDGKQFTATGSIGISLYPDDGRDPSTLLKHADAAMYGAKAKGRNAVQQFRQHLADQSREQLTIESDLRLALNREEFLLHYQPQVDLHSGAVFGVEALIRWEHPQKGLISPGKFIPIAERNQMIIPMGEWVLREACRQNIRWQEEGRLITVSVNVAAMQFARADFVDTVIRVLNEVGLHPKYLEVEVTEGIVMHNIERVENHLDRLRYYGVSVALDDFGTGFSSLQYLQDLPFDKLKIDQSFVRKLGEVPSKENLATNPQLRKNTALIEHMLQLARGLDLKVIAEGIETAEQAAFLKELDCEQGQGYYFAKPCAAEKVFEESPFKEKQ